MNNYEYANRSLMVDLQGFTISNIEKNLLLSLRKFSISRMLQISS